MNNWEDISKDDDMGILDTVILTFTFGFITLLGTGALWAVTSSPEERRAIVKERVLRFSKIAVVIIIPAVIYFFPENSLIGVLEWFHKDTWRLRVTIMIPFYIFGGLLLYHLIREIWGE